MKITSKWWLNRLTEIRGFEGEGEGGTGEGGQGEGEGQGAGDGSQGEGQGEGEGDEGSQGEGDDAASLKTALERERRDRRKADRELKALRKDKQDADDAELTEIDRLKKASELQAAKTAKLAEGYRRSAVKTAVLEAARKAGFADPTDAMRDEVLNGLGVEQDEDDPTEIEIDEADLTDRVKKLLKAKPHYQKTAGEGDNNQQGQQRNGAGRSGSKFGGGAGNKNDQAARNAELAQKYPALRSRVPQ